jgi:hypothetical protein
MSTCYVSGDFSTPETVADSEFYRVIPVERADMIVIDSIYLHRRLAARARPQGGGSDRFGAPCCSTTPGVTGTCVARATQRNSDLPRRRLWDRAPQWTDIFFY